MDEEKTNQIVLVIIVMGVAITLATATWIFGINALLSPKILVSLILVIILIFVSLVSYRKKKLKKSANKIDQVQENSSLPDSYIGKDFERNTKSFVLIASIIVSLIFANASMIMLAKQYQVGPFESALERDTVPISEIKAHPENYLNKIVTVKGSYYNNWLNSGYDYCFEWSLNDIRLVLPSNIHSSMFDKDSFYYFTGTLHRHSGNEDFLYISVSDVQEAKYFW